MDTTLVSLLHGTYAAYNLIQFVPTLLGGNANITGFDLTYQPFAVSTHLTLAGAPTKLRVGQALATLLVCAPHVDRERAAQWHAGMALLYLGMVGYHKSKENNKSNNDTKPLNDRPLPVAGRVLVGLFGVSQLGVSMWFLPNYLLGKPSMYEPFIRNILSTTDKVPLSRLTSDFLRGVCLAGTYVVSGIGVSLNSLLTKAALLDNSANDTRSLLVSGVRYLGAIVTLHTICYLSGGGGPDLHQYMFVHGPMISPALGVMGLALYLCGAPPQDDDVGKKKSK